MYQINDGEITVFGQTDGDTLKQMERTLEDEHAMQGVLCADNHKGYAVPIGGVVAYREAVSPSGVGFDIGCGNKAVLTDMPGAELRTKIDSIMDDIWNTLSFGVGRKNNESVDAELFDSPVWTEPYAKALKDKARQQLGTIGSGNHYVDLFTDEQDRVWIGVHFGSRGFGHGVATHFLKLGGGKDGMDVAPLVLALDSEIGQDYVQGMQLAGEYAYAGRNWVCARVAQLLGAQIVEEVHNHHNYAWSETHNGVEYMVIRKGATPAFPGQRGFIGGSMGEDAVIVEGVDSEVSKTALYSTVHGAGRTMGRNEAKRKIKPEEMNEWLRQKGVTLRGGGLDESPQAYKRLPEVLQHHEGTIRILHTLKPVGVAMAGPHEFDPYKD
ncbi:MAG TPA: RtcB family protein [Bryobacteraceae bacterium]|jgi:tRNA-splicing ligase RtcB|nr:RtcB family protein [Bryobacteraceae bacterium]